MKHPRRALVKAPRSARTPADFINGWQRGSNAMRLIAPDAFALVALMSIAVRDQRRRDFIAAPIAAAVGAGTVTGCSPSTSAMTTRVAAASTTLSPPPPGRRPTEH